MLAGRDDVRLAAVLTDQHLLGWPERVTGRRQDSWPRSAHRTLQPQRRA